MKKDYLKEGGYVSQVNYNWYVCQYVKRDTHPSCKQ